MFRIPKDNSEERIWFAPSGALGLPVIEHPVCPRSLDYCTSISPTFRF
jgi:hypothetical protein